MSNGSRPTVVLVHGSFHGGWCWQKVTSRMEAAGVAVYPLTLTGLGERSHLLSTDVGLETHVLDVVGVLEWENLTNVVLVGHSYGGMVVTGAADRCSSRVGQLVYLDASIPESGRSQYELRNQSRPDNLIRVGPQQVPCLPLPKAPTPFGVSDREDLAWLRSKLTPHPIKTKLDRLYLQNDQLPSMPKIYISCTLGWDGLTRAEERLDTRRARADPTIEVVEIESVHDAMITAPDALAKVLADIAGRSR